MEWYAFFIKKALLLNLDYFGDYKLDTLSSFSQGPNNFKRPTFLW
jgi:hypothetical protein